MMQDAGIYARSPAFQKLHLLNIEKSSGPCWTLSEILQVFGGDVGNSSVRGCSTNLAEKEWAMVNWHPPITRMSASRS
jgi:hypothetical protein